MEACAVVRDQTIVYRGHAGLVLIYADIRDEHFIEIMKGCAHLC